MTVLCLFFATGHFSKAEQMNVLTQLHVANRQNVSMFTLGYPHPCESMLCVWVSYNRNENKRCVLYIVQNLRAHFNRFFARCYGSEISLPVSDVSLREKANVAPVPQI